MKKRLHDRKRLLQLALSLCLIFVSANVSWGQLHTDTTPGGIEQYIVPAGVTSITISTWGAGGAGGSAQNTASAATKGGGGAGGSYAKKTAITVNPDDVINFTVGAGGTGLPSGFANGTASGEGGFSSANVNGGPDVVKALGGLGGQSVSTTTATAANGTGGTAYTTGNTGDIGSSFWGGNGGTAIAGTAGGSGGGGGSAGTASNGNNGAIVGGGAVLGGGAGGNGSNANNAATPGAAGSLPGGGGAGAIIRSVAIAYVVGGSGGNGKVIIENAASPTISASTTALSGFVTPAGTASAAQSFTVTGTSLANDLIVSTSSTDYELSKDNFATAGVDLINLGLTPTNPITISVRLKSGLSGGTKTANISVASIDANVLSSVACTGGVSATYHYVGSGLLSLNTNWGTNTDGSGTNPTAVTDTYTNFVIANGNATTNAPWTLGSNSKVIVGNGSAVSLTVADTFPIIGTIDAAANGSVVWQHVLATTPASPTFGSLDNDSEVHFQPAVTASYGLGNGTAYGKLFIDGAGKVNVLATISTATVKKAFTVESGSTLDFPTTNTHSITINTGASATINGTVRAGKQGGLLGSTTDTTPATTTTVSILFVGTPTLTLGASSTVDYFRPNAAQTVSVLPSGKNYANLTLSETAANAATTKSIAGAITVNGTLTVDLAGGTSIAPVSSITSGADKITLADGATIVMTSGALNVAPIFGETVNVTYNGKAAQTAGFEIPVSGLKILTINNTVSVTFNSLSIESGASANVLKGNLIVTGAITNNGSLTIENKSNLVQTAVTNTNSGSGTATVKRNSNALFRLDYTMWSSPVNGAQTLAGFSPLTSQSPNRFFTYNPATNLYVNVSPTSTFSTGTGYLIRMPNTDPTLDYDAGLATLAYPGQFTGTLNNGTFSVTTNISGGYYSVGNPYPSTIDAAAFLGANTTDGTLYFWRKTNAVANSTGSAYATWTTFGSAASNVAPNDIIPNGTIQVGQGFIVKSNGASLSFTNAMRLGTASTQFFKTKQVAEKSRVWLNLTNTVGAFSQALVGYVDGATLGVDNGIDGKYINDSAIALTSNINGEEYTIQGRPAFDATDVVALNFKTDVAGDYTIALDHFDGLFTAGQDIYLKDNNTGAETDLKAGSYTFAAASGVDNTRFSLKYQKTLKVDDAIFNENNVAVYAKNGSLYVNSGEMAINSIQVYDVQGRLLAERKGLKTTTAILENLKANNQVLLVKVLGANNKVVTKKVVN
jgi:hypothetical protein